jgi:hypothetical protein
VKRRGPLVDFLVCAAFMSAGFLGAYLLLAAVMLRGWPW